MMAAAMSVFSSPGFFNMQFAIFGQMFSAALWFSDSLLIFCSGALSGNISSIRSFFFFIFTS